MQDIFYDHSDYESLIIDDETWKAIQSNQAKKRISSVYAMKPYNLNSKHSLRMHLCFTKP